MTPTRSAFAFAVALLAAVAAPGGIGAHADTAIHSASIVTHYRTATVDGVSIFYREAGPADGPVVLLLHGFPTSSHMFRNLIPALADRYRVIAPDYPGFGDSAMPDHTQFAYTFGHYADLIDGLMQQLGAQRYAIELLVQTRRELAEARAEIAKLTPCVRELYEALAYVWGNEEDCESCAAIEESPCELHGSTRLYNAARTVEEVLGPCRCGHHRMDHHTEDSTACMSCSACQAFRLPAPPAETKEPR